MIVFREAAKAVLAVLLILPGSEAVAQSINISFDTVPKGVDIAALEQGLTGSIDSNLVLDEMDATLSSMAKAASISSSGIGVDYVSNPRIFVIGGGLGAAGDGLGFPPDPGDQAVPAGGFASTASLMGGLNLGVLTLGDDTFLDRIRIYGHGLVRTAELDGGLEMTLSNYGGHLQFAIMKPVRIGLGTLEWGGFSFTTGYEHTTVGLGLSSKESLDIGAEAEGQSMTWQAQGSIDIESAVDTIPLELSTNIRVMMFALYGGAAYDLTPNTASASLSLAGPITLQGPTNQQIGTADVSFDRKSEGPTSQSRMFGGAQFEILVVKLYAHANIGLDGNSGFHMGGRVAF